MHEERKSTVNERLQFLQIMGFSITSTAQVPTMTPNYHIYRRNDQGVYCSASETPHDSLASAVLEAEVILERENEKIEQNRLVGKWGQG